MAQRETELPGRSPYLRALVHGHVHRAGRMPGLARRPRSAASSSVCRSHLQASSARARSGSAPSPRSRSRSCRAASRSSRPLLPGMAVGGEGQPLVDPGDRADAREFVRAVAQIDGERQRLPARAVLERTAAPRERPCGASRRRCTRRRATPWGLPARHRWCRSNSRAARFPPSSRTTSCADSTTTRARASTERHGSRPVFTQLEREVSHTVAPWPWPEGDKDTAGTSGARVTGPRPPVDERSGAHR